METEYSNTEDIKSSLRKMLKYIGDDPDREGLIDTPDRIVRSWKELYSGYGKDPKDILTVFEDGVCDEMVLLKNIEFYSMCEHHVLPFYGHISLGYVPNGKVVGISKLARLVEIYARRLQIQEKMTSQIADALVDILEPKGVMVKYEATHFCMVARGIQKQDSRMVTSAVRGVFRDDGKAREEFLYLIRK